MTTRSIIPRLSNPNIDLASESNELIQYGNAPVFDFSTGEFVLAGGNFEYAEGVDCLRQWVVHTLNIPISTFLIYDSSFGNPVNNLIERMSIEILRGIVPRIIKNLLEKDDRIELVHSFRDEVVGDSLLINFVINTFEYEDIEIEKNWSFG